MAIADTVELVNEISLKDNFTPTAKKVNQSLRSMESTSYKVGQNIGKGLSTAAGNIKKIGIAAGVGLAGLVAVGVKNLGDLQRSQAQTEAVIKSTGGSAHVSAEQVREYAESLENITTVDDKVIQDGENMLLTFTNIGGSVFPEATRAATNMAVAMAGGNVEAVDLKSSAIQLGKALNDPIKGIGALSKVGVTFTDQQKKQITSLLTLTKDEQKHYLALRKRSKAQAEAWKQARIASRVDDAQRIILAELNKEFGKAGEAAGKGPEAVWRRLQDAGEGLSTVLARGVLPALERVGTFITEKLADKAFLARVDEIGQALGRAVDDVLVFVQKLDFNAISNALGTAAGFAGTLVGWFLKMPAWVQTAVITGWGLNKLTGGAFTDIFGTLAQGLIKGVLGMNAGVVNINAGVVNGGGPGLPGVTNQGAGTLASLIATVLGPLGIAGAALAGVGTTLANDFNQQLATKGIEANFKFPGNILDSFGNIGEGIRVIQEFIHRNDADRPGSVGPAGTGEKLRIAAEQTTTEVENMKGKIAADLADQTHAIAAANMDGVAASKEAGNTAATAARSAGSSIVSAIYANRPMIAVDVNVSGTGLQSTVDVNDRYGPAGGDRNWQDIGRGNRT